MPPARMSAHHSHPMTVFFVLSPFNQAPSRVGCRCSIVAVGLTPNSEVNFQTQGFNNIDTLRAGQRVRSKRPRRFFATSWRGYCYQYPTDSCISAINPYHPLPRVIFSVSAPPRSALRARRPFCCCNIMKLLASPVKQKINQDPMETNRRLLKGHFDSFPRWNTRHSTR